MYVIKLPNEMLLDLSDIRALANPNDIGDKAIFIQFKNGDVWYKDSLYLEIEESIWKQYESCSVSKERSLPEPYAWETKEGDILHSEEDKEQYEKLYNSSAWPLWDEDALSNAGII